MFKRNGSKVESDLMARTTFSQSEPVSGLTETGDCSETTSDAPTQADLDRALGKPAQATEPGQVNGPFDPGDIKEMCGFDRNDPNVTVRQIPMGRLGAGAPHYTMPHADDNLLDDNTLEDVIRRMSDTILGGGRSAEHRLVTRVLDILEEVFDEVRAAQAKHAPMHSPHEGSSVIREEFEELWDEVKADRGRQESARKEAIQVAATAVRYIFDIDPK